MQIVVRQVSGLGNQLFQYAAGRYYAQRFRATLRVLFDARQAAVSHGLARPRLLSHFAITAAVEPMTQRERLLLSPRPAVRMALSPVRRMLGIETYTLPFEQRFECDPPLNLPSSTRTAYLAGYWQNHCMADAIAPALRAEFAFREPAHGQNLAVLQQIQRTPNAVSLHVRRGDYTLAAEGNIALPLSYYHRAMDVVEQQVTEPTYFVFSDDIAFARQHLPAGIRAVFVDHNDDFSSQEDIRLMSACSHHIIANSSFSWWGAWLNGNAQKLVVAPRHWLLTADSYYPGLLPPSWTLLDSLREG